MRKHTPGPWRFIPDHCIVTALDEKGREELVFDLKGSCGAVGHRNLSEQVDANIRLITMAPELLDALEDLAELVETNLVTHEVSDAAWEAEFQKSLSVINKAIGKGQEQCQ
ncbi:hypothetical protein [Marinobacterium sedimentorum]|uniref:hypothetical protein n=1 Tax=Marinobacterium sedimentorum TaxID=2927804 RepID=UPI0020C6B00D|nr:hypothetical protein [Marinobacterium sedimentorum]MCP8685959.1 hypothetical protein [Marinobacterium sedimentorum]